MPSPPSHIPPAKQPEKPADRLQQLEGVLDHLTFRNEESGFTVARLATGREQHTVVGNLAGVPIGSSVRLTGRWRTDRRYGRQFAIERFTLLRPNTVRGIERYLGSGLVRGIGPAFARRIVRHFGLHTLEILDNDPERLAEIRGIGEKRIAAIKAAWREQRLVHEIMVFLQAHDISATFAVRIYKTYGEAALAVVQDNPYRLAEDIRGIGFKTADRIAAAFGIQGNDPRRLRAGVIYVLNEATADGHTFLPRSELARRAAELLGLDHIDPAVEALASEGRLVCEEEAVYLASLYHAECGAGGNLRRIAAAPGDLLDRERAAKAAEWAAARQGITLAPEQREALITALTNKVSIITGGPGTGKSTILRSLVAVLRRVGEEVLLAAPTGRAAKRLAEATGMEAKTIHRLLEFDPGAHRFRFDRDHPLTAHTLIVDEVSMVDVALANALFRALADRTRLVLVGDADQLPSVGPGNVFRDCIASQVFPCARLTTIFRQGEGSLISVNAQRINKGEPLDLAPSFKGEKDFYCIFREEAEEVAAEIVSLAGQRLVRRYGFDPVRDIQVLTPMRRGVVGADHLNEQLQGLYNPDAPALGRFRKGDKVMQVRNDYDKDVYNGDLGVVQAIDREKGALTVEMDGRRVEYDAADLADLALAWATTIHKAQGSEFPCVLVPLHTTHYPLLQRNLLYTAVTRGKRLVILVGSKRAISIAIRTAVTHRRHTRLQERLRQGPAAAPNTGKKTV